MKEQFHHVFGPVPSRRLGRSLGVDLVPYKTCSYDCIYCQLGRTTDRTVERRTYVPVDAVIDEVRRRLDCDPKPDYITLSGSGEPTLHDGIGSIIDGIQDVTDIPVAVLTNGSLLWMKEVRDALTGADLVIPSLDAARPETFARVNRPHRSLDFDRMVEGLIAFREYYEGTVWLEIFLLKGINDSPEEIDGLVKLVSRIKPDRVQLNTVSRPPAEESCQALTGKELERIAVQFSSPAEIIADIELEMSCSQRGRLDDIAALCRRRPCTIEDIAGALNLHPSDVAKYLGMLERQGTIRSKRLNDKVYFASP